MGNDGGSIPTRRELVKEAARNRTATELKESLHEQQTYYWTTDPLTQRPLVRPIVSDALGRLFNKESVLEFLLPSEDGNENKRVEQEATMKGTVKSLKDVVEVKFEVDASGKEGLKGKETERWVCPITNKELGPGAKSVYIVPCGHAFAETTVKEVSGEKCLQCDEPYAPNDVIPILPTLESEIARLTLRIKTLGENGLSHSLKKVSSKKRKKEKEGKEKSQDAHVSNGHGKPDTPSEPTSRKSTNGATSGIQHAATASLTAKVLQEQEERNKKRKLNKNENLDSLFSGKQQADGKAKNTDFLTRGYSITNQQK